MVRSGNIRRKTYMYSRLKKCSQEKLNSKEVRSQQFATILLLFLFGACRLVTGRETSFRSYDYHQTTRSRHVRTASGTGKQNWCPESSCRSSTFKPSCRSCAPQPVMSGYETYQVKAGRTETPKCEQSHCDASYQRMIAWFLQRTERVKICTGRTRKTRRN
jgi:hypothetical protein